MILAPPPPPKTIQQAFEDFHRDNPWVYDMLVTLARRGKAQGRTKLGMNNLWEVMRWETWRATFDGDSAYKLNDRYTSRYARLIEETCPDLVGMFELRRLRTP